jgi:hypothetical protein
MDCVRAILGHWLFGYIHPCAGGLFYLKKPTSGQSSLSLFQSIGKTPRTAVVSRVDDAKSSLGVVS